MHLAPLGQTQLQCVLCTMHLKVNHRKRRGNVVPFSSHGYEHLQMHRTSHLSHLQASREPKPNACQIKHLMMQYHRLGEYPTPTAAAEHTHLGGIHSTRFVDYMVKGSSASVPFWQWITEADSTCALCTCSEKKKSLAKPIQNFEYLSIAYVREAWGLP